MIKYWNSLSRLFWRARNIRPMRPVLGSISTLLLFSCATASAPLSIEMYNAETDQTLTCTARDKTGRTDTALLAAVVESCAKQLEARGFVRQ